MIAADTSSPRGLGRILSWPRVRTTLIFAVPLGLMHSLSSSVTPPTRITSSPVRSSAILHPV